MTTTEPVRAQGPRCRRGVSPEPILRLASGFMAAKHLSAASELGIFEALSESQPRWIRSPPPPASPVERPHQQRVGCRPLPRRTDQADLRPLLRFWYKIS